jgi:hypothetical protein
MNTATLLLILSAGADIASTEYGISRGLYEANPLMQRREVRICAKAGVTTVQILAANHLESSGHPGWANFVRATGISLNLAATGWNVSATVRLGK